MVCNWANTVYILSRSGFTYMSTVSKRTNETAVHAIASMKTSTLFRLAYGTVYFDISYTTDLCFRAISSPSCVVALEKCKLSLMNMTNPHF